MYPLLSITDSFSIYTFGVCMILAWALFFYLLHSLSLKKGLVQHIFVDIFSFIVIPFIFGRLFHLLAEWREEKFIFMDLIEGSGFFVFLTRLFLTDNYNLSFAGCVLGFLLVFFFKTRKNKTERPLYYDVVIPAFLAASIIGYAWAFLGGQIYGIPYDGFFSLTYDTKDSIVPFRNALFPLPILYVLSVIIIILYLYRIWKKWHSLPNWFIGYMGFGLFGIVLFLAEFLNGSSDMLSSSFVGLNLNQVVGLYFIGLAFVWLGKSLKFEDL